jgi:hypothetical protein
MHAFECSATTAQGRTPHLLQHNHTHLKGTFPHNQKGRLKENFQTACFISAQRLILLYDNKSNKCTIF